MTIEQSLEEFFVYFHSFYCLIGPRSNGESWNCKPTCAAWSFGLMGIPANLHVADWNWECLTCLMCCDHWVWHLYVTGDIHSLIVSLSACWYYSMNWDWSWNPLPHAVHLIPGTGGLWFLLVVMRLFSLCSMMKLICSAVQLVPVTLPTVLSPKTMRVDLF